MRWILDRKEESSCGIEPNIVTKTYQSICGRKDKLVNLGRFANLPQANMIPIYLQPDHTTRGLESVSSHEAQVCPWSWWSQEKLSDLFNAMIYCGKVPSCVKHSWTTSIPKTRSTVSGCEPVEVCNNQNDHLHLHITRLCYIPAERTRHIHAWTLRRGGAASRPHSLRQRKEKD